MNATDNERSFREQLSSKVCSSFVGLWFLVAEHLRLGSWDLVKGYTGGDNTSIDPRIGMQVVNEASVCANRLRPKNYMTHQGFELVNGLGFLVTDKQVHDLFARQTVANARDFQQALSLIRLDRGHYEGDLIALDPHRIVSYTKRQMPQKKKLPNKPAQKILQTFFALDAQSGQPVGFTMGSPAVFTSRASKQLLEIVKPVAPRALLIADKEHFNRELIGHVDKQTDFDLLFPAPQSERIRKIEKSLTYTPLWAGYAIGETMFKFRGDHKTFRLIVQREGERQDDYVYKSFLTLSGKPAEELMCDDYSKRWAIEDFFNFEGALGFDRASTMNQNIRYGKMSLALLAQAANYQLRQKLPEPYNRWNAKHLAETVLTRIDGDVSVEGDTIVVTGYNVPQELGLEKHYRDLPQKLSKEGIDPRIPWMYNYKLDFRFR